MAPDRTTGAGRLPDFVIIGAMKSGTSSLHEYLDLLPDVCMSRPKEPAYFVPERFAWRDRAWYEGYFTSKPQARHRGEASPHYSIRHVYPGVADCMHDVIPDARIVYIVRDPIERIRSEWLHHVAKGRIHRSLSDELRDPESSVIFPTSKYFWQLEPYLDRFGASRVLVASTEQLRNDPKGTVDRVCKFLEIEGSLPPDMTRRRFNDSGDKRRPNAIGRKLLDHPRARRIALERAPWLVGAPIEAPVWDPDVRARVADALRDDVAALRDLTGEAFAEWSV
jgi:hypothetical protein